MRKHSPASRRPTLTVGTLIAGIAMGIAMPAHAIVYGQSDGDRHPAVGSLVFLHPSLGPFQWCSGTLVGNTTFLTAAHCTAPIASMLATYPGSRFVVTFDPVISHNGTFYDGIAITNPEYGTSPDSNDTGDIALFELASSPGITPAQLAWPGLLDEMKASGALLTARFTAVGYGATRDNPRGADGGVDSGNLERRYATQDFRALRPPALHLAMTQANGNGGTCYGDSGGPHFLHMDGHETDIVVSITMTGDVWCKAFDWTYRVDAPSATRFLASHLPMP